MTVRIIADSASDISAAYVGRVTSIPLLFRIDGQEYLDGVNLTKQEFYKKLVAAKDIPATSQPSPATFEKYFRETTADGSEAIYIALSSKLSGTYQSARMVAEDFPNVHVVDSLSAALGSGILIEYAVQLADAGKTAAEIVEELENRKRDVILFATLDTLEYLRKGGRISGAIAAAAGLLRIKPVITLVEGEIVLVGKPRGIKGGMHTMDEKVAETGEIDYDKPIMLAYSGNEDTLLEQYKEHSAQLWAHTEAYKQNILIAGVIGVHVGPGAFACAYFRKH